MKIQPHCALNHRHRQRKENRLWIKSTIASCIFMYSILFLYQCMYRSMNIPSVNSILRVLQLPRLKKTWWSSSWLSALTKNTWKQITWLTRPYRREKTSNFRLRLFTLEPRGLLPAKNSLLFRNRGGKPPTKTLHAFPKVGRLSLWHVLLKFHSWYCKLASPVPMFAMWICFVPRNC